MTLNKLFGKLKSQNKTEYRQFQFCLVMAVLLITSYVEILFSPLVQNALPEGGDSGKQIYMIFGIAAIGCAVFAVYAASLFLRYKSREIGVFLALGTEKGKMARALMAEMSKITCLCSVIGIVLGSLLGFVVGKCFEWIAGIANDSHFAFTAISIISALLFCLILYLCIAVLSVRFMKRTDIMEIVNEQRRQEPLKNMVTSSYLWSGLILSVIGVIGGFMIPNLSVSLFHHWLGAWTNLFYLLVVAGIYRIMVYSIAVHKRGARPQKYYNNMIAYGMLKFQGASIVRNMLVITLLLIGGLFAAFYLPANTVGVDEAYDNYEADYSYRYPKNVDEVSQNDLEALGEKYQIKIENYREAEFIQVVGNGVERDSIDENGNLIELPHDEYAIYDCISVSGYYNLTGKQVEVLKGQYLMIQRKGAHENVYNRFDDMSKLYDGNNQTGLSMKYMGIEVCSSLVENSGFDSNSRFIINDEDYETLKTGLPEDRLIKQILFDTVESENTILFANELYKEYCLRASEDMKVMTYYDPCEEERVGVDYGYAAGAVFDPYNSIRETDWQYKPIFVYLESNNFIMSFAIKFLLFFYVSFICLAAVGIVSYTRSKSIAIRNRQAFADMEKLGANHMYLQKLLKKQIQKIFVLPTAVGCGLIIAYEMLIRWQNDGRFDASDLEVMAITVMCGLAVVICQYMIYRFSMKATTKMLGIEAK